MLPADSVTQRARISMPTSCCSSTSTASPAITTAFPIAVMGSHVAPLGLSFSEGGSWSGGQAGAVIGLHGSWNRKPQVGYKVVFVPFADGKPAGAMQDLLTGFLDAEGNARGRPVGIAIQQDGGILVADDVGNAVWRLAPAR